MIFDKIKYSKCPYCKKHGIPAFEKIAHRGSPVISCKYCHKEFSVNIAFSIVGRILLAVFAGGVGLLFNTYIIKLPLPCWIIFALLLYIPFEYFAPLQENDKKQ